MTKKRNGLSFLGGKMAEFIKITPKTSGRKIVNGITYKHVSKNDEFFRKNHGYALAWRCSICNQLRLDKFISVYPHDISDKYVTCTHNIRYCNDNEICEYKAKHYYDNKKTKE